MYRKSAVYRKSTAGFILATFRFFCFIFWVRISILISLTSFVKFELRRRFLFLMKHNFVFMISSNHTNNRYWIFDRCEWNLELRLTHVRFKKT